MVNSPQKQKMIDDFLKELEAYNSHYVYLSDLVSICEYFCNYDFEKSKAPNSMRIIDAACVDTMMIEFAKFYENNEDAKSIQTLLKKCLDEGNLALFQNQDQVQTKINEFNDKIEKDKYISTGINTIKERRDKYLAHNDSKYFVDQTKDDSYLPMYKLWIMKDFIKEVIYFLYAELGGNTDSLKKTIYNDDIKNIEK